MQTKLGQMLRRMADMADNGECGVDAETLEKTVELHMLDHQRINILSDAVKLLMKRDKPATCLKVHLNPNKKNGKKE